MALRPNSAASANPALHCGPEGSLMAVGMAILPELDGPQSLYTMKESGRAGIERRIFEFNGTDHPKNYPDIIYSSS